MDSPRLIGVVFLLLAITGPHPNIAMASPAGMIPDSSSGRTKVTVYCCKDCALSTCEDRNFGKFAKVTETQTEKFSNGAIELVTEGKRIFMCFQQGNASSGGIYAIVWEKTGGAGYLCGNPNSTAFSENGRGNISTEKIKICCEADTNVWEPNTILNCYTEMSEAETTDIPGEGIPSNPEFVTSKKRGVHISLILVLLLVLCGAVTMTYFCRKRRYHPGNFPSIRQLLDKGDWFQTKKNSDMFENHLQMRKPVFQQHLPLHQCTTIS